MKQQKSGMEPIVPVVAGEQQAAALREQALALYCEGRRVSEIATTLETSASTIRRWLKASLEALADEARVRHAEQLARRRGATGHRQRCLGGLPQRA